MVAIALLLLSSVLPGPDEELEMWLDRLSAADPAMRELAARELYRAGDRGADALESREFLNPGARLLARDLLIALRAPTATILIAPVIATNPTTVLVELVIRNRRPVPIRIEPYFQLMGQPKRGKKQRRWVTNRRWSVTVEPRIGAVIWNKALTPYLRKSTTIPARGDASLIIPISVNLINHKQFDVRIRYAGDDFEIVAKQRVRVGAESLRRTQRHAFSRNEAMRSQAVIYVRYRLRARRHDAKFLMMFKAVSYSPYRDVRMGVAKALRDYGQKGNAVLVKVACRLASDPDATVANAAMAAVVALVRPQSPTNDVLRLAARSFARPHKPGAARLLTAMQTWPATSRRRFLGAVLASTRSRAAHKEIAGILRRDGVPVEEGASGLVPASQIKKLKR